MRQSGRAGDLDNHGMRLREARTELSLSRLEWKAVRAIVALNLFVAPTLLRNDFILSSGA
jgi:hypothetical protein